MEMGRRQKGSEESRIATAVQAMEECRPRIAEKPQVPPVNFVLSRSPHPTSGQMLAICLPWTMYWGRRAAADLFLIMRMEAHPFGWVCGEGVTEQLKVKGTRTQGCLVRTQACLREDRALVVRKDRDPREGLLPLQLLALRLLFTYISFISATSSILPGYTTL